MGKIISIANQKGGVGKTTTAINLSASLAVAEKRTLLIDCDSQGNATSGIGIDRARITDKNLYHVLIGSIAVDDAIYSTSVSSLDIVPANLDLIGVEVEFVSLNEREMQLRNALAAMNSTYEYIIIDCPPSLGFLTINALVASHSLIIPLQCEYFAMEGLGQLLNTIKLIQSRLNTRLTLAGILLTMFDTRNRLSHQVYEEVHSFFSPKVFDTFIPRNVRLSESPSHGLPVILYDVNSRGAAAYMNLAQELITNGNLS